MSNFEQWLKRPRNLALVIAGLFMIVLAGIFAVFGTGPARLPTDAERAAVAAAKAREEQEARRELEESQAPKVQADHTGTFLLIALILLAVALVVYAVYRASQPNVARAGAAASTGYFFFWWHSEEVVHHDAGGNEFESPDVDVADAGDFDIGDWDI